MRWFILIFCVISMSNYVPVMVMKSKAYFTPVRYSMTSAGQTKYNTAILDMHYITDLIPFICILCVLHFLVCIQNLMLAALYRPRS